MCTRIMVSCLILFFAGHFVGCAAQQSTSHTDAAARGVAPPDALLSPTDGDGAFHSTERAPGNTPLETYPERAEVRRLLHRAAALVTDGSYESALEVVHQALRFDPRSPSALHLKAEIEELLRRLDGGIRSTV